MISAEMDAMNARKYVERLNVRHYCFNEIMAKAVFLILVKVETFLQITFCRFEYSDIHEIESIISFLAIFQSMNLSFPS